MKLFLLKNKKMADFDEIQEIFINAASHKRARRIAAENAKNEGADTWLCLKSSSCVVWKPDQTESVIMINWVAG